MPCRKCGAVLQDQSLSNIYSSHHNSTELLDTRLRCPRHFLVDGIFIAAGGVHMCCSDQYLDHTDLFSNNIVHTQCQYMYVYIHILK